MDYISNNSRLALPAFQGAVRHASFWRPDRSRTHIFEYCSSKYRVLFLRVLFISSTVALNTVHYGYFIIEYYLVVECFDCVVVRGFEYLVVGCLPDRRRFRLHGHGRF